ncbi:MAG TPA: SDR family NAD(P)-dependent oxidoreductase [Streptosporangiaceae bacterium]|nr:SDR family NAD(P)-dependent oxidoreductase [Streptosporangiaceae bacterium]
MAGVVIVGAGPGIATSVARRFAAAGMPVGLVARTEASIDATRQALAGTGVAVAGATADAGQDDQLTAALDILTGQLGAPSALVYNAGLIRRDRPGELSREQYVTAYAINVLGAMTAAVHVAPAMAAAGGGSIVITGGMPEPDPALTSLSLGKAGVRALTTLLASEYGPAGIHVATVTVGGAVAPGGRFDPDRIAEEYWRLHTQRPEAWEYEVALAGRGRDPVRYKGLDLPD